MIRVALYLAWGHCLLLALSTVNQNGSTPAAHGSIHACCDTDTIVAAQLSRISLIRGVKQFGQLPLSKAQAAVQWRATQILLHAFSFQFPDQPDLHNSLSLTLHHQACPVAFNSVSSNSLTSPLRKKIVVFSSAFSLRAALYVELNFCGALGAGINFASSQRSLLCLLCV